MVHGQKVYVEITRQLMVHGQKVYCSNLSKIFKKILNLHKITSLEAYFSSMKLVLRTTVIVLTTLVTRL
jgi:hypothetical protein